MLLYSPPLILSKKSSQPKGRQLTEQLQLFKQLQSG